MEIPDLNFNEMINDDVRIKTIIEIMNIMCKNMNSESRYIPCQKHLKNESLNIEKRLYEKKRVDCYTNKEKLEKYVERIYNKNKIVQV